jgi:hypothetical protein
MSEGFLEVVPEPTPAYNSGSKLLHGETWILKDVDFDALDNAIMRHVPGRMRQVEIQREQITPTFVRYQYMPTSYPYIKDGGIIEIRKVGNGIELFFSVLPFPRRASDDMRQAIREARDLIVDRLFHFLREDGVWPTLSEPTPTQEAESGASEKRGPTYKTKMRAEVFKRIKYEHPGWSQAKVALEAMEQESWLGEISGETVRNAYRAMGWDWERANRVR